VLDQGDDVGAQTMLTADLFEQNEHPPISREQGEHLSEVGRLGKEPVGEARGKGS
jgi:hypothetical protein